LLMGWGECGFALTPAGDLNARSRVYEGKLAFVSRFVVGH